MDTEAEIKRELEGLLLACFDGSCGCLEASYDNTIGVNIYYLDVHFK